VDVVCDLSVCLLFLLLKILLIITCSISVCIYEAPAINTLINNSGCHFVNKPLLPGVK